MKYNKVFESDTYFYIFSNQSIFESGVRVEKESDLGEKVKAYLLTNIDKVFTEWKDEKHDRQLLINEKNSLNEWLKEHDYIGTKIATNRATYEEYADVIAEMNIKANRINEIKLLLGA